MPEFMHSCMLTYTHTHNGQGMRANKRWQACSPTETWKTANTLYTQFRVIPFKNIVTISTLSNWFELNMTLQVWETRFQTASTRNLRWVCLTRDNHPAKPSPSDCQISVLCISLQPWVWFPLQISCYGHVLINLGLTLLGAHLRCLKMDCSETQSSRAWRGPSLQLFHSGGVF